jgi:hypothetical protein
MQDMAFAGRKDVYKIVSSPIVVGK